jgi:hypothetical protein
VGGGVGTAGSTHSLSHAASVGNWPDSPLTHLYCGTSQKYLTLPGAGVGVFGVGGVGPEFVHQVPNFGVHVDGDQFRVSHVLLPWLCREIILVGDTFD